MGKSDNPMMYPYMIEQHFRRLNNSLLYRLYTAIDSRWFMFKRRLKRKIHYWYLWNFTKHRYYAASTGAIEVAVVRFELDHNIVDCLMINKLGEYSRFSTPYEAVFDTVEGTKWYYEKWRPHFTHIKNFGGVVSEFDT